LLPNEVSSDAKKFNEGFKDEFVPSSGPFKATKLDKSAKTVTMEPNDKWWGNKPKLDKITYRVVSQPQQGQAFANKEIDLVDIGTD
ncbi:ABC transporter substrate-binding protein, partial [Brevibacterium paucivorans]